MTAGAPDTGLGATIVFGTSAFTGCCTSIAGFEFEVPKLDTSCLSTTTQRTHIAGDLNDVSEFDVEFLYNTGVGSIPSLGVSETITVTYPKYTGQSTAAKYAGTGFIRKIHTTDLKVGELMKLKLTVTWDGQTAVAYTPAA